MPDNLRCTGLDEPLGGIDRCDRAEKLDGMKWPTVQSESLELAFEKASRHLSSLIHYAQLGQYDLKRPVPVRVDFLLGKCLKDVKVRIPGHVNNRSGVM
jgi:hypothetical protein